MDFIKRFLLIGILVSTSLTTGLASELKDKHISNSVMSVGSCVRDAGAICSIVYNGMELVNDIDHGRQLQIAWIYNDLDEQYNPTESGSNSDFTKKTTTSRLLSINQNSNTLSSVSHPAYWLPPKTGGNSTMVTNDLLYKNITLGWKGDPNIIVVDATIVSSPILTGPPISTIRVEAPTIYTIGKLTDHFLFDTRTGALTQSTAKPKNKNKMNTTLRQLDTNKIVPILSTTDGKHAVGMYTDQREGFWSYITWGVPSDEPENATNKATIFFKHPAQEGKTYTYRSYLAIGTLQTVQKSLMKLAH
jgi:hypothetical protein